MQIVLVEYSFEAHDSMLADKHLQIYIHTPKLMKRYLYLYI